jgi:uncharacterized protein YjiS (DUF1127 family)
MSTNCADFGVAIERRFAGSSAANRTGRRHLRLFAQPIEGDPVMIEERLHGDDYAPRTVARPPDRAWVCAFGIYDPASQLGAPSSTPLKLRFTENVPLCGETQDFFPLSAIRRIVSAIRLWRARARSRQELCQLSDHQLSDIGLRRENVGYGFLEPFCYRD